MDGYVGIKYRPVKIDQNLPVGFDRLFHEFSQCAAKLKNHGMAQQNAGNMSMKFAGGFAITSSGSNLGQLDPDEIVLVKECSPETEEVKYTGYHLPSSEALLHYLIYGDRTDALAIVHAHDPAATSDMAHVEILKTSREEPYGTIGLARIAAETFQNGDNILILKNHGYVALGLTLTEATDSIVRIHVRLVAERSKKFDL